MTLRAEPSLTTTIISKIPEVLKEVLLEIVSNQAGRVRKETLMSSNSLANRFIQVQWGIRPSQRRQYRNLFSAVRTQCRNLFLHYSKTRIIIEQQGKVEHRFGVYKFDEIRGNLILGFVYLEQSSPFL